MNGLTKLVVDIVFRHICTVKSVLSTHSKDSKKVVA